MEILVKHTAQVPGYACGLALVQIDHSGFPVGVGVKFSRRMQVSAEGGSKSVELGREADNGHSLARLKPMNQVGGKADTCGGLSTDTAFLFGNGAEGVVAVESEAVFHGWR